MDPRPAIPSCSGSEPTAPRVLLVGFGPTGPAAYRSIRSTCRIIGVVCELSGEAGAAVRALAHADRVPLFAGETLAELEHAVEMSAPDIVALSSYSRIVGERLLRRVPFVNVHYSPLPRYRGRANVNWAVINGERAAAISIHRVDPGLDSGSVLFQAEIPIGERDAVTDLYARLNAIQERELGAALVRAASGENGVTQDELHATYCCARTPDDGEIDWRASAASIDRQIRALASPFPSAFTFLDGVRLDVVRAMPRMGAPRFIGRVPGRVVGRSKRGGWVDVLTGDGVLRLVELCAPGTAPTPAAAWINSTRQTLGLSRKQLLDRLLLLEARVGELERRLVKRTQSAAPERDAMLRVQAA